MSKLDLSSVGFNAGNQPRRVAASATRYFAGEPMNSLATLSSGAASVNTIVVLTDTKPRIGTDDFQGIAAMDAPGTGTVTAHTTLVTVPIPYVTRIRGRAKVAANVDTDAELILILGDALDFDLTTAVYTIDDTAASNASGLTCVNGNPAKSTLDVVVDARAMRVTVS